MQLPEKQSSPQRYTVMTLWLTVIILISASIFKSGEVSPRIHVVVTSLYVYSTLICWP